MWFHRGEPPPEVIILTIYMLLNMIMCHQNVWKFCPRLRQKQSDRMYIFLGGACPRPPHRHFAYYYHCATILFPLLSQNPIWTPSKHACSIIYSTFYGVCHGTESTTCCQGSMQWFSWYIRAFDYRIQNLRPGSNPCWHDISMSFFFHHHKTSFHNSP